MKFFGNHVLCAATAMLLISGCSDSKSAKKETAKSSHLAKGMQVAWQQNSINNLKQIGAALELFCQNSPGMRRPNGMLKSGKSVETTAGAALDILYRDGHLADKSICVAPWDEGKAADGDTDGLTSKNTSYTYIYVDDRWSGNIPVSFEKPWRLPEGSDSINVLYADGHVGTVKIPDVKNKSCREVLEILLAGQSNIPPTVKASWIKYADLEDQYRD